jgi:hypothetical protein
MKTVNDIMRFSVDFLLFFPHHQLHHLTFTPDQAYKMADAQLEKLVNKYDKNANIFIKIAFIVALFNVQILVVESRVYGATKGINESSSASPKPTVSTPEPPIHVPDLD